MQQKGLEVEKSDQQPSYFEIIISNFIISAGTITFKHAYRRTNQEHCRCPIVQLSAKGLQ
jgi:hypothetical protein